MGYAGNDFDPIRVVNLHFRRIEHQYEPGSCVEFLTFGNYIFRGVVIRFFQMRSRHQGYEIVILKIQGCIQVIRGLIMVVVVIIKLDICPWFILCVFVQPVNIQIAGHVLNHGCGFWRIPDLIMSATQNCDNHSFMRVVIAVHHRVDFEPRTACTCCHMKSCSGDLVIRPIHPRHQGHHDTKTVFHHVVSTTRGCSREFHVHIDCRVWIRSRDIQDKLCLVKF